MMQLLFLRTFLLSVLNDYPNKFYYRSLEKEGSDLLKMVRAIFKNNIEKSRDC